MLSIGQLASYAGLTVRAVRHYHQVGLLPEPERDASGYRTYSAATVPRLIRIRTPAQAGVSLARVRELLDADPLTFAAAISEIDRQLREQIRALQKHRRRIAQLSASDSLAVPEEVVDYLDRLRAIGAPPAVTDAERDSWILMAARWPDAIPGLMADKVAQLADPRMVRLYQLFGRVAESEPEEEVTQLVRETADLLSERNGRPSERAVRAGSSQRGARPAGRGHAGRRVHPVDGLLRRWCPPRHAPPAAAARRAWVDRVDSGREAQDLTAPR